MNLVFLINFSKFVYDDGNGIHIDVKTIKDLPTIIEKLKYYKTFERRLVQQLKTSIFQHSSRDENRTPIVHSWFTTSHAIFIFLTNGNVQINFYDHSKMIINSNFVTFINNGDGQIITNLFVDLIEFGVPSRYRTKLLYIQGKVHYFITSLK